MSDNDVNKIQQNVKELQDQNAIDFQQWKKLGKDIEKLSEKIKTSDKSLNILMKKIKNDYENLKKIIVDENVQVQLNNKIEKNKNEIVDNKNKIELNNYEISKKVNVETFQITIDEFNSQMDSITHLIDSNEFELIGYNEYKLVNDITLDKTLIIPSNTKIKGLGKKITSNFDGVVLKAQGKNITIDGLKIDCNNKACTGIFVDSNSSKVNVVNNEIYNSYGGTSKPVYGIFVSAIGCNDVNIINNSVHDLTSLDNGVIAQRDGGWAKGIIVDLYDLISDTIGTTPNISTNITIENNTIENIQDGSDADGIYLEGFRTNINNNYVVINNNLKNCGKRFIKVLNCGDVKIERNYGINTNNNLHAFISLYTGGSTVKNNTMLVNNGCYSRYGVEIGHQAKYGDLVANDIIIEDNKFNIGNSIDYGVTIARPNFDGILGNVKIKNNELRSSGECIKFVDGASVSLLTIEYNSLINNNENKASISINNGSISEINIENNKHIGVFSNAFVIKNSINGNLNIKGNKIDKSTYTTMVIDNFDNVIIENNIINTTTSAITITNTTNSLIQNNYDMRVKKLIDTELLTFKNIAITSDTFNINMSLYSQISTIKITPTVETSLSSLDNGVDGQILTIVLSNNITTTFTHSSSLHLKGNTSLTLNTMEQSITLLKLDNRWLEISRNF